MKCIAHGIAIAVFLVLHINTSAQTNTELLKKIDELQRQVVAIRSDVNNFNVIQELQRQVATLRSEINSLNAIINNQTPGTLTIRNNGIRNDVVGTQYNLTAGTNFQIYAGNQVLMKSDGDMELKTFRNLNILSNNTVTFTTATTQTQSIGLNHQYTVGKDVNAMVGNTYNLNSGNEIFLEANKKMTFKCGNSSIILNKNGDVEISGINIRVKGNSDMLINGKKILANNP